MRTLAEDGISPLPEDHEAISQLTGQAEHGTLKPVVVLKLIDRREAAETLGIGLSNFKKLEGEGAFPFKRKMVVLLDQGASLPLVQGIVGHFEGSDKSVTVRSYYHPQLEAKLQVLKLMPYPENLASRLKMCESSDKQIAEQITSLQVIEGV